jgi:short-subunit dehydrogenase
MNEKKIALITGAGSGLGRCLALELSKQDYFVVLIGRDLVKLEKTSKEITNSDFLSINTDISDLKNVYEVFEEVKKINGNLEIVINSAGEGVFGKVGGFTNEKIERVLSANLIGTILMSQESIKNFVDNSGTIVNIMSTASNIGRSGESIYCAAKWGAKGFTESLKLELKGSRIKIFSVYPGGMKTPFWNEKSGMNPDTSTFMNPDEVASTIIDNILNKNSLQVTDITINRK